jgi:hypothetical protein
MSELYRYLKRYVGSGWVGKRESGQQLAARTIQ